VKVKSYPKIFLLPKGVSMARRKGRMFPRNMRSRAKSGDWQVPVGTSDQTGQPMWGAAVGAAPAGGVYTMSSIGTSITEASGLLNGRNPLITIPNAPRATNPGVPQASFFLLGVDIRIFLWPNTRTIDELYSVWAGLYLSHFATGATGWEKHNPATYRPAQVESHKTWLIKPVHALFFGLPVSTAITPANVSRINLRASMRLKLEEGQRIVAAIDADSLPHGVNYVVYARMKTAWE
jgi:hypothetical protein